MKKILIRKFLTLLFTILAVSILFSQEQTGSTANLPQGYGDARWGTTMDEVRSAIIGRLVFIDDERIIISRDGDIEYTYGFFYAEPQIVTLMNPEIAANINPASEESNNSTLFYVSVKFPFLPIDQVRTKFEAQYGAVTIDEVNKNRGVVGWLSENTLALIYINEYEDKQYTARITYVSREIVNRLNEYVLTVFNQAELEVMRSLAP